MEKTDSDILGFLNVVADVEGISMSPEARDKLEKTAVELTCDDLRDKLLNWLDIVDPKEEELSLPEKAPELYAERIDKSEDAISFFHRVYGPWLEKGVVIYQDNLRGKNGLDPKLLKGIENKYKQDRNKIANVVPPKSSRIKKEVEILRKTCDVKKMARLVTASYSHN